MKKKIIKIRDLEYTYPNETVALCGINLDVFEEENIGIVGPNGAGKSTLLQHMNGLLRGKGRIEVCGLEINDSNLPKVRQKVGLVFQNPNNQLFMPTVFDDVAFGPINLDLEDEEVKERVKNALSAVGMEKLEKRISHHLSFGEKKRICLATVLSMDPEILVLDEPSSNLDPKSRRNLISLLKRFNHTKIISGHDLELILETSERSVVLDKGKIVACGNTIELLSDEFLMESHGLEVPPSLSNEDTT